VGEKKTEIGKGQGDAEGQKDFWSSRSGVKQSRTGGGLKPGEEELLIFLFERGVAVRREFAERNIPLSKR